MNPLNLIREDRTAARDLNDPNSDRCVLGTINSRRVVAQRVLVLREIEGKMAVFYSSTSAKHRELTATNFEASLLVFLPSIGIQYRMSIHLDPIDSKVVKESWQLKPNAARRMDALYRRYPQSSVIDSVVEFETAFAASVAPRHAAQHSVGYFIQPTVIERLQLKQEPNMHLRFRYTLVENKWVEQRLVP